MIIINYSIKKQLFAENEKTNYNNESLRVFFKLKLSSTVIFEINFI